MSREMEKKKRQDFSYKRKIFESPDFYAELRRQDTITTPAQGP